MAVLVNIDPDTWRAEIRKIVAEILAEQAPPVSESEEPAGNILASVTWTPGDDEAEILKGAEPQRYCLGIAYQAGPAPSIARGQDGGRDFLDAADLEKSAWEFLANGPRVGMFHLDGTETTGDGEATATVVESYIYRPDQPWDLGNGVVVNKGDWLLGAILSPRAWDMYQRGLISGWSPQGLARRHPARAA